MTNVVKTAAEKREAANTRRRATRAAKKTGPLPTVKGKPRTGKVDIKDLAKSNHPAAKANAASWDKVTKPVKATDPKLLKLVQNHAEKNKDRNGWDKVAKMATTELTKLLAGAKTPNAAIKRARALTV